MYITDLMLGESQKNMENCLKNTDDGGIECYEGYCLIGRIWHPLVFIDRDNDNVKLLLSNR